TLAAIALARLCYDTILEYGPAAVLACRGKVVTPALEHIVEANTLHSGLGFESGGLASAHSIHNGLTMLNGTHGYQHAEKVTIGALAGLFVADGPAKLIDGFYTFGGAAGLQTPLPGMGLKEVGDDDLRFAAERACADGKTIHPEPLPVTPQAVIAA